ncbi:MAG TPA: hypothetical protein QF753_06780 [Victivallales bacterium]|nr:hypothetical protein [Victivallales bacterium]
MSEFKFQKYLSKIDRTREIQSNFSIKNYLLSIVIPVYGEYEDLGQVLYNLTFNDKNLLKKTLITIIINSPAYLPNTKYIEINNRLLSELKNNNFQNKFKLHNLNLCWIDASTAGNELSGKGGVGRARKLGMDYSLFYMNWNLSPLIISLDGDTLVEEKYLESIFRYFESNNHIVGTSISFKHQKADSVLDESAIREYEVYLHDYVYKLKNAKSPYAYYTIGSAMAFRAEYYIKAGGMKTHRGGEDFYFMQSLRKLGKIGHITDTSVHPSSRISGRVPFGTGPRLKKTVGGSELKLYNPKIFDLLGKTLREVRKWLACNDLSYSELELKLDSRCLDFLEENNFSEIWDKIVENNLKKRDKLSKKNKKKLLCAFHVWFDAFKTLKFIHYLENEYPEEFPKINIQSIK